MSVLDLRPASRSLYLYQGDPVNVRVHVFDPDDGAPVDVSGWVWAARIGTSPPTNFECFPEDDGVTLYLRGDDTWNIVGRWWPYDVTGRNPDAGEGVTVLRGEVLATARVSERLIGTVTR